MTKRTATVRLHVWLETDDETLLGSGRAMLLDLIEEHGSLRKAARSLGMSYRGAWGKIHASEEALGVKLLDTAGSKRDGCRLSEEGRQMRDMFQKWFNAVEQAAILQAKEIFPWAICSFEERHAAPKIEAGHDTPFFSVRLHPAEEKRGGALKAE